MAFYMETIALPEELSSAPVTNYLVLRVARCGGHTTVRVIHSEILSRPLPLLAFALEVLFTLPASIAGLSEPNHATRSDLS